MSAGAVFQIILASVTCSALAPHTCPYLHNSLPNLHLASHPAQSTRAYQEPPTIIHQINMSTQKEAASRTASARRIAENPYRAPQLRRIREAYTKFYLSRRDYIKRLKKENLESTVVVPPLARCSTTLNDCTLYELGNIARDFEYKAEEMAQRYETLMKGFTEELERKHREEFERWEKTTVYNCGEHSQEEGRPANREDGYEEMDEESDVEEDADGVERLTREVIELRVDENAECAHCVTGKTPPAE